MKKVVLVTGANGHLGNNLVRKLAEQEGVHVKAGVRNIKERTPFTGVQCEVVYADLLDRQSLLLALEGVDTLYQVAAVYKRWAKNPERDIIHPNVTGTKNILEAAAQHNVNKVVYVSSIAALDKRQVHMDETSWNQHPANPYYISKTESERFALKLAKQYHLFLVSVLPSAMIGPHCYGHLTPTMEILHSILTNKQTIDPGFHFNFVSIDDVAAGMIAAERMGRNGERYILGTESPVSTSELFTIANSLSPHVKIPMQPPKAVLLSLALLMEAASTITRKEPQLTRDLINTYYSAHTLDISKSRVELGYHPHDPIEAITSTMEYLKSWKSH